MIRISTIRTAVTELPLRLATTRQAQAAGRVAPVLGGGVAGSMRDSLAAQTVTYSTVAAVGLGLGSKGVGALMHRMRIAQLDKAIKAGTVTMDDAARAAFVAKSEQSSARIGNAVLGTALLGAAGVAVANFAIQRSQLSTVESIYEQQQSSRPAAKVPEATEEAVAP